MDKDSILIERLRNNLKAGNAKQPCHTTVLSQVDAWLGLQTRYEDITIAGFIRDMKREPTLAERIRLGQAREAAHKAYEEAEENKKKTIASIVECIGVTTEGTPVTKTKDTQLRTHTSDNTPIDNTKDYNFVNHPKHYNSYDVEVVDMMERIWGPEDTATWCKMTAFKYRMRMGLKPTDDISQDLEKEKWYLDKAEELKQKIGK